MTYWLAFLPRIEHEQSSTIGSFGASGSPESLKRNRERERATFEASSRSRERGTKGTKQSERIEQTERREKREKLSTGVHYSVQTETGPKTFSVRSSILPQINLANQFPLTHFRISTILPNIFSPNFDLTLSRTKMVESLVEMEYPDHQTPKKDSKTKDFTLILEPPMPLPLNRSHSQASCQKVTPTPETHAGAGGLVEIRLPNGDLYIGTFLSNVPHGLGKYLWPDGCMYEGEWKKGKSNGKGKFSWPFGAYL
ncbi:hypothetical protein Cgig2_014085 [Carnegiea gigantea]|uniref:Uncharacterized protein n=1 Tax=Carnegiea gigantea TaxID=171969 RepID=A0A9Q1KXE7_9CARY|nr:hypothetical protein Cgig2_014085 [Carnegiea gigantea]